MPHIKPPRMSQRSVTSLGTCWSCAQKLVQSAVYPNPCFSGSEHPDGDHRRGPAPCGPREGRREARWNPAQGAGLWRHGAQSLWVPVQCPGAPPTCGLSNRNSLSHSPRAGRLRPRPRPLRGSGGLPVLDPTSGGRRRPLARGPITPIPAATFTWLLPASPSLTGTLVIKLTLPHAESLTLT